MPAGRGRSARCPGFPPEPLLDLVIDPASSDRLIASTERELYETDDAGRSWKSLAPFPGLLAWLNDTLALVDAAGGVHASGDDGHEWARVGEVGGQPAALLAEGERTLYVALHDGTIMVSLDVGRSWDSVRSHSCRPTATAGPAPQHRELQDATFGAVPAGHTLGSSSSVRARASRTAAIMR